MRKCGCLHLASHHLSCAIRIYRRPLHEQILEVQGLQYNHLATRYCESHNVACRYETPLVSIFVMSLVLAPHHIPREASYIITKAFGWELSSIAVKPMALGPGASLRRRELARKNTAREIDNRRVRGARIIRAKLSETILR
jgi:hypothetical protein